MPDRAISPPLAIQAAAQLGRRARLRPTEIAFWLLALASLFLLPGSHLILNEIAILALFALSLDLVLGFGGIVSLGHAAYFGFGAYVAGLLALHVNGDPLLGLLVAGILSALLGLASSFLVLRGSDLTRLIVTLGIASLLYELTNRMTWLTGGADGLHGVRMAPLFGRFTFDLWGHTAYAYSLTVLAILFFVARRIVYSPFGVSLVAIKGNPLRASAIGVPVNARLVTIYTIGAAYAGVAGALLAQTAQFVSLDVLAFHRSADVLLVLIIGGAGFLYGGIAGAMLFKLMQDFLANLTPQYWMFWIGLLLVLIVLVGRERVGGWGLILASRAQQWRARRADRR